jgi:hypothetical protein
MPDHVHMLISIPPKYPVAEVIGYLKGKSSIWIAQNVERKLRNFLGHKFWARGYFVSTVGRDEEMIRASSKIRRSRTSSRIGCNSSSRPHKVPSLVPESFITASGGSPPNPSSAGGYWLRRPEVEPELMPLNCERLAVDIGCNHRSASSSLLQRIANSALTIVYARRRDCIGPGPVLEFATSGCCPYFSNLTNSRVSTEESILPMVWPGTSAARSGLMG